MSAIEFNQMFPGNTDFLKPFAISLTRDPEAAKDLYQETLYRALLHYTKYNAGTNIKAWLFTIMRNIFINDYRRKAKQQILFDNSSGELLLNNSQATVANKAEEVIGLKEINKAIHHLPRIFKTPFLLYLDGYHYHEIAAALNEPLGTIKSRIHFARKLLKEQISRY